MEQQQQPPAPSPTEGQQAAQAAILAAAAAANSQQAASLAAMLPQPGATPGATPGARPALALHPALAAMSTAGLNMLPMGASPAAFAALAAARPGMPTPPFFFPAMPQLGAPGSAQQLAVGSGAPSSSTAAAAAAAASSRRPSSRPSSRSSSGGPKKHCNCKNSRCLKLYCECFASGRYCDGCNCANCHNNREHEATRQSAVEAILERNPNAFRPKIAGGQADSRHTGAARHNKGCNCKKSGCLKKYCECFQAGIVCSENCKCLDCKNYEGSEAREALISPQGDRQQAGSPLGLRRSLLAGPGMPAFSPSSMPPGSAGLPGFGSPGGPGGALGGPLPPLPLPKQMTSEERQELARGVVADVIKPEVVEKLAFLLMVVSQEEAERRRRGGRPPGQQEGGAAEPSPGAAAGEQALAQQTQQEQQGQQAVKEEPAGQEPSGWDGAAAMDIDVQQQQQQPAEQQPRPEQEQQQQPVGAAESMDLDAAAAGANGLAQPGGGCGGGDAGPAGLEEEREEESLYQAQERLILTEFRDTLQMISRVVGEKVDKKVTAAQAQAHQLLLPPMPAPAGTPGGTPGAMPGGMPGMLGALALPQLKPGSAQPGVGGGMLMAAGGTPGQPQLVLLPPGLMAQHFPAAGQQFALLQTAQGLKAVMKPPEQQQAQQQQAAQQQAAQQAQQAAQQQQQQQQQQQLALAAGAPAGASPPGNEDQ